MGHHWHANLVQGRCDVIQAALPLFSLTFSLLLFSSLVSFNCSPHFTSQPKATQLKQLNPSPLPRHCLYTTKYHIPHTTYPISPLSLQIKSNKTKPSPCVSQPSPSSPSPAPPPPTPKPPASSPPSNPPPLPTVVPRSPLASAPPPPASSAALQLHQALVLAQLALPHRPAARALALDLVLHHPCR